MSWEEFTKALKAEGYSKIHVQIDVRGDKPYVKIAETEYQPELKELPKEVRDPILGFCVERRVLCLLFAEELPGVNPFEVTISEATLKEWIAACSA